MLGVSFLNDVKGWRCWWFAMKACSFAANGGDLGQVGILWLLGSDVVVTEGSSSILLIPLSNIHCLPAEPTFKHQQLAKRGAGSAVCVCGLRTFIIQSKENACSYNQSSISGIVCPFLLCPQTATPQQLKREKLLELTLGSSCLKGYKNMNPLCIYAGECRYSLRI